MTISDMIKKVEAYNEMSELLGVRFNKKMELNMIDESSVVNEFYAVKDSKSFKKEIKDAYIGCCAEAILGCKEYEFNTPYTFEVVDAFGSTLSMKVMFTVSAL